MCPPNLEERTTHNAQRTTHYDPRMHLAWPGLANVPIDGWVARLAGGVTRRANSVLPLACPRDVEAALREAEALYRAHGLASTFQISPDAQPASLDALLADRGYELRSPTLVLAAGVGDVLRRLAPPEVRLTVTEEPDEEWMDLWWAVDARGGPEARDIARRILLSCPSLYAAAHDDAAIAATGRLALVGGWGGIYCMAVRADARRRGYARTILHALMQEAARRAIEHAWLQVVETNQPARALYEQAGFVNASRYHYRTQHR